MDTANTRKIKRKGGYQKITLFKEIVKVRRYSGALCISNWPIPKSSKSRKIIWAGPIPEPLHSQGKRILKRRKMKE